MYLRIDRCIYAVNGALNGFNVLKSDFTVDFRDENAIIKRGASRVL
jgi:hypothetical protein